MQNTVTLHWLLDIAAIIAQHEAELRPKIANSQYRQGLRNILNNSYQFAVSVKGLVLKLKPSINNLNSQPPFFQYSQPLY